MSRLGGGGGGGGHSVKNLTESCLWGNEARLTPEQLLRGFSNSL